MLTKEQKADLQRLRNNLYADEEDNATDALYKVGCLIDILLTED